MSFASAAMIESTGRRLTSFTDCKSVVTITGGGGHGGQATRGHSASSAYIQRMRRYEKMNLDFTRSHPERRIPTGEEWSFRDVGISIADSVAGGEESYFMRTNGHTKEVDMRRATDMLERSNIWYWSKENGPMLEFFDRLFSEYRKSD